MAAGSALIRLCAVTALLGAAACNFDRAADVTASSGFSAGAIRTPFDAVPPRDKRDIDGSAGKLGYVFTYFWPAVYESPEDCPDGPTPGIRDFTLASLSPADRVRYGKVENASGLTDIAVLDGNIDLYNRSHGVADKGKVPGLLQELLTARAKADRHCEEPEAFADRFPLEMRTVKGKHAYGMNLDGNKSPARTCQAEQFTTPDGRTKGVDNQFYRLIGCIAGYRRDSKWGAQAFEDYHHGARKDGQMTIVMEITGIDDSRNDDEVQVGLYSSMDPTLYDADGGGIANSSYTITENRWYRNMLRGKIVDGVLHTQPAEIHLEFAWATMRTEYLFRDARLELPLKPEPGKNVSQGLLGGYYDLLAIWSTYFGTSANAEQLGNYSCPAVWKKIKELADGFRDPKTGACTALSSAFKIEMKPAFIIHSKREGEARTPLEASKGNPRSGDGS